MRVTKRIALRHWMIALLAGASWGLSPAAIAQQTPSADDPPAAEEESRPVEKVVVTGSRIRRNEYTSSSPIQVITTEEATLEGLQDTAEILQTSSPAAGSPQINATLGGFVTPGGQGASGISLRGLGANRTLVLMNGRRLSPAGSRGQLGNPDLNVLPTSVIERIEILTDGGSSVYGSDAVAGAINVLTRKNYEGATVSGHVNLPFAGGGETYQLTGAWGQTFDRGNIMVAAEYYERSELRVGDRSYLNCAQDLVYDATGRSQGGVGSLLDTIDPITGKSQCTDTFEGVLVRDVGGTFYHVPGTAAGSGLGGLNVANYARVGTSWTRLARTAIGGNQPFQCGFFVCTPEQQYLLMTPAQRAATEAAYRQAQASLNQDDPREEDSTMVIPVDRMSLYLEGSYELTSGIEAYTELLFNNRKSVVNGIQQLFPLIPFGHPSNPFGPGTNAQPIILVPQNTAQDVDFFRGVWGIRGELGQRLGVFSGWTYDFYVQWSRSDATYETDFMYNDRVLAATATPLACNPALITISGPTPCPVIPWHTARVLDGNFTPEERAFIFGREAGTTTYDQTLVNGVVTGDAFSLPAGAVSVAVGFEARSDEIDDTPGANARARNYWGLTTAGQTAGSDSVFELFGEVSVPILSGTFLAESLTLDASGRYTEYDSYGEGTVYKLGLNWQITPEYRLRGTTGTSFRAPALFEMFLGDQTGFLNANQIDPCIRWDESSNPDIVASCGPGGIGLPPAFPGGASGTLIRTGGGGVGQLRAETSEAKTLGFIWTPDWIDFSAAADLWRIEINDQVAVFGAGTIVNLCLTREPRLTNGFCALVNRDVNPASPTFGQIFSVDRRYRNLPQQLAEGLDLHTRFGHEFSFGKLTVNTNTTWTFKGELDQVGDGPDNYNGETYFPDVVGNIDARFDYQDWTISWNTDFFGRASDADDVNTNGNVFSNYGIGTPFVGRHKNHTEFTATHDTSVRYREADWELIVGVQNIFDEEPPAVSTGTTNRLGNSVAFFQYDLLGRRGFITLTKEF